MNTKTLPPQLRPGVSIAPPDTISTGAVFDAAGARRFTRAVARLSHRHPAFVIIDMSRTQRVESSGFGSLVSGLKKLADAGATPYIVCADPSVRRLMDFAGVSRMFAVVERLTDASRAHERATADALAS